MSQEIPAGFYRGRAIAGSEQYGNTRNGGEQLVIDVDVPSLGRALSVFLYFTDKAAPYALEKLRACGWAGDDVTKLVGIDKNEVDVAVKYETYNGEERMKVDIQAGGGGRVKLDAPMDDKSKRMFGARVAQMLKQSPGNGVAKPKPAPSVTVGDDDIPF